MKLSKVLKSLGTTTTIIGPFRGNQAPVRSGVYVRVSPKTGAGVFAHWDNTRGRWGLYADTPERALARKNKFSKKDLPWYASADSSTAKPVRSSCGR